MHGKRSECVGNSHDRDHSSSLSFTKIKILPRTVIVNYDDNVLCAIWVYRCVTSVARVMCVYVCIWIVFWEDRLGSTVLFIGIRNKENWVILTLCTREAIVGYYEFL